MTKNTVNETARMAVLEFLMPHAHWLGGRGQTELSDASGGGRRVFD